MLSHTVKLIGGLALGLALAGSAPAQLKPGQPFPALAGYGLEGALPALSGQVVLVDFWASWCAPCKASFPAYAKLQHELAARGFVLLAVSVDKEAGPYAAFLQRFHPGFATVRDGAQKLVAEVQVPTMPTSYLIDRQGIVREVHTGFHGEGTVRALRAEIIRLLEEKS
jgi:thiol-disulfide isomerase/thioredoxin